MQKAGVYRNEILAGYISRDSNGNYMFVYTQEYLIMDDAKPLSVNLKLRLEPYISEHLFSFFYNMLAEGDMKDMQCKKLRIDKDDDFSRLLETTHHNTIGSVTVKRIENNE
ncbi:MAG: HipA N-terminal domain-containing protein [Campylobacterota bacterium]|nr:HipA N-terminal domain-containing protein [Campylobacterota bacterium]